MITNSTAVFIIYASDDKSNARYLCNQLNAFHLPRKYKNQAQLSEFETELWLDTDFVAKLECHNDLLPAYRIVLVCSPRSACSPAINEIIKKYINKGRTDCIIPYIIKGHPYASASATAAESQTMSADQECFPRALLQLPAEETPLGINEQEVGKSLALVKLKAALSGLPMDALRSRHAPLSRLNRRICWGAVSTAVIFMLLYWVYKIPKEEYYSSFLVHWGIPEGLFPLSADQCEHKQSFFKFTYQRVPIQEGNPLKWRVVKVENVNSRKHLIRSVASTGFSTVSTTIPSAVLSASQSQGLVYPVILVNYDENGKVSELISQDEQNRTLMRMRYTFQEEEKQCIVDLWNAKLQEGVEFLRKEKSNVKSAANICRIVYYFDDKGYVRSITFHANDNKKLYESLVRDEWAVFGYHYEYDSLHRPVSITAVNQDGAPMANKEGIVATTYSYDSIAYGEIFEQIFYDKDNHLIHNKKGYAKVQREYDAYGNPVYHRFYDENGQLVTRTGGYAQTKSVYDEKGFCRGIFYIDNQGKCCMNTENFHQLIIEYNEAGLTSKQSYFNLSNQPCLVNDGYASKRIAYDSSSRVFEESYYGTDGNLCLNSESYAIRLTSYDENGYRCEYSYYGVDKKPCMNKYRYAKLRFKRDDRGNETEYSYFDIDGNPCEYDAGISISRRTYDAFDNAVSARFYDKKGRPSRNKLGVAGWTAEYDEYGRRIKLSYIDEYGAVVDGLHGYASSAVSYDSRGNKLKTTYFDKNGKRTTIDRFHFASMENRYDNQGNVVWTGYFGTDGRFCKSLFGYSYRESAYDQCGNCISSFFFDEHNNPCTDVNGCIGWTETFDNHGRSVKLTRYDISGNEMSD